MSIKDQLQNLSEDSLRQKILIPLLFILGCKDVRDNCGPAEYGKDILYLSRDHFLREKIWGAAIVKKGEINKSSLENINRQVSDAINQFIDPDDPRNKIQLHEILIITSKGITSEALKYIHEQSGKNFQNIHFINGSRLEFLINQVILEYNLKLNTSYIFNIETFGNISGRSPNLIHSATDNLEGKTIE